MKMGENDREQGGDGLDVDDNEGNGTWSRTFSKWGSFINGFHSVPALSFICEKN